MTQPTGTETLWVTQESLDRLREELDHLKGEVRADITSKIAAARDEDVDAVGLSMLSGAHLALAPPVVAGLRAAGIDAPVVVGGIVPDRDVVTLLEAGVAAVIGPGSTAAEVVAVVDEAIANR